MASLLGRRVAVLVAAMALLAASQARAAEISWRVENPFRLFLDPADTHLHANTWRALTEVEREQPIQSAERVLASLFPRGWAEAVFRKTCWDEERNQYGCKNNRNYFNPTSHRVIVTLEAAPELEGQRCEWRSTPLQGKRSAVPKVTTAPCGMEAVIEVPYPGGARVSVRSEGPPVAEIDIAVEDILIVGLGDSFGSGEGNPDMPVVLSRDRSIDYGRGPSGIELKGYPTRVGAWKQIGDRKFFEQNARWLDQACHRSLYSHQVRVALQLAIENPHRAVTFASYACSGAEVTDGLFLVYKGSEWVPKPTENSQISAVASAQCAPNDAPVQQFPVAYQLDGKVPELNNLALRRCGREEARRIDLLLVSIGGNDIGFARLVANAVLADRSTLKRLGGWFGHIHGIAEAQPAIANLEQRYKSLKRGVHNILHVPWDESDRVLLTAYPPIAIMADGKTVCPDDRGGMSVYPEFALNQEKAREGEELAEHLNAVMAKAAKEHGWTFADAHRPLFNGHGICARARGETTSIHEELRLPVNIDGEWTPYNPADFQPYAPRTRWFRTPNDAYLTGHFHVSDALARQLQKVERLLSFQLVLASTYSGAFHPTAEGHAIIGDSVVIKAREILKKYQRRQLP
ncbi:MAG: hypothetical protein F9K44_03920 [Hyphomicrobiaceae bacterium]|nr:MAG: hypothetical protein F9K44_03920 [Hyphomicrobiaceae bacterium]